MYNRASAAGSEFYKTQLRPTLIRINAYVIRWARRKFKRMRHQSRGVREWLTRVRRAEPDLFIHWNLCHGCPAPWKSNPPAPRKTAPPRGVKDEGGFWQRPNIGSRVTREGHARFWERPEVKFLGATRQFHHCPLCRFSEFFCRPTKRARENLPGCIAPAELCQLPPVGPSRHVGTSARGQE